MKFKIFNEFGKKIGEGEVNKVDDTSYTWIIVLITIFLAIAIWFIIFKGILNSFNDMPSISTTFSILPAIVFSYTGISFIAFFFWIIPYPIIMTIKLKKLKKFNGNFGEAFLTIYTKMVFASTTCSYIIELIFNSSNMRFSSFLILPFLSIIISLLPATLAALVCKVRK